MRLSAASAKLKRLVKKLHGHCVKANDEQNDRYRHVARQGPASGSPLRCGLSRHEGRQTTVVGESGYLVPY